MELIKALSHPNTIALFNFLANDVNKSDCQGWLSKKQYYTALHKLKETGMITPKQPYKLTCYGKIVYQFLRKISTAVNHHKAFNVINQLDANIDPYIKRKIVDALIEDEELKEIVNNL